MRAPPTLGINKAICPPSCKALLNPKIQGPFHIISNLVFAHTGECNKKRLPKEALTKICEPFDLTDLRRPNLFPSKKRDGKKRLPC